MSDITESLSNVEKAKREGTGDIMVFDLDPDEGMDLSRVRQGVRDMKNILGELSLNSYLKTSGGKGYHVVVGCPCPSPGMNWTWWLLTVSIWRRRSGGSASRILGKIFSGTISNLNEQAF